jgi:DNA-nicking Smr family endonuclease
MLEEPEEIDPNVAYRIEISSTFDLHAFAPRDMKAALEEFLFEAHSHNMRELRIIHGRGIGVQREMVRNVLAKTPFVASFGDAPLEAGGWGATLVTLRA